MFTNVFISRHWGNSCELSWPRWTFCSMFLTEGEKRGGLFCYKQCLILFDISIFKKKLWRKNCSLIEKIAENILFFQMKVIHHYVPMTLFMYSFSKITYCMRRDTLSWFILCFDYLHKNVYYVYTYLLWNKRAMKNYVGNERKGLMACFMIIDTFLIHTVDVLMQLYMLKDLK